MLLEPDPELSLNLDERTLFGVPIDPDWWLSRSREERDRLVGICRGRGDQTIEGRRHDAGLQLGFVVGAMDHVRRWVAAGIEVRNRAWLDVGGSTGYYALALKLWGARRVVLLDEEEPGGLARLALSRAGVDVVTAEAHTATVPDIDSMCVLYAPCNQLVVAMNHPDVTLLVEAPPDGAGLAILKGGDVFADRLGHIEMSSQFLISEDCMAPFHGQDERLGVVRREWGTPAPDLEGRFVLRVRFSLAEFADRNTSDYGAQCWEIVGDHLKRADARSYVAWHGDAHIDGGGRDETFCIEIRARDVRLLRRLAAGLATDEAFVDVSGAPALSHATAAHHLVGVFGVDAAGVGTYRHGWEDLAREVQRRPEVRTGDPEFFDPSEE